MASRARHEIASDAGKLLHKIRWALEVHDPDDLDGKQIIALAEQLKEIGDRLLFHCGPKPETTEWLRVNCQPPGERDLAATAASLLLESLPASTKLAIDQAIAAGVGKAELVNRIQQQCGGQRTLTVLAVEQYLGLPAE